VDVSPRTVREAPAARLLLPVRPTRRWQEDLGPLEGSLRVVEVEREREKKDVDRSVDELYD